MIGFDAGNNGPGSKLHRGGGGHAVDVACGIGRGCQGNSVRIRPLGSIHRTANFIGPCRPTGETEIRSRIAIGVVDACWPRCGQCAGTVDIDEIPDAVAIRVFGDKRVRHTVAGRVDPQLCGVDQAIGSRLAGSKRRGADAEFIDIGSVAGVLQLSRVGRGGARIDHLSAASGKAETELVVPGTAAGHRGGIGADAAKIGIVEGIEWGSVIAVERCHQIGRVDITRRRTCRNVHDQEDFLRGAICKVAGIGDGDIHTRVVDPVAIAVLIHRGGPARCGSRGLQGENMGGAGIVGDGMGVNGLSAGGGKAGVIRCDGDITCARSGSVNDGDLIGGAGADGGSEIRGGDQFDRVLGSAGGRGGNRNPNLVMGTGAERQGTGIGGCAHIPDPVAGVVRGNHDPGGRIHQFNFPALLAGDGEGK